MPDVHNLTRFVDAQAPVMAQVLSELKAGRKTTHWMWFVFPQIEGLGSSPMARRYALASLAEASAFAEHDILGPRLRACTGLINALSGRSIGAILGSPDDLKFHSCMTLFSRATSQNDLYLAALDKYYAGQPDQATVERLAAAKPIV